MMSFQFYSSQDNILPGLFSGTSSMAEYEYGVTFFWRFPAISIYFIYVFIFIYLFFILSS